MTVTFRVAFPAKVKFPVTLAVSHAGGFGSDKVTFPAVLFLMERVRFAVWFTVTFPKERFPVTVKGGGVEDDPIWIFILAPEPCSAKTETNL